MRIVMRATQAALLILLALASGCNSDPAAPQLGTITINVEPNSTNASWQVTGPDGFSQSGAGDTTFANMTPGNYSIQWGVVAGWSSPDPSTITQTLASGGQLVFSGTYIAADGVIVVDADPDLLAAHWELAGPGGYAHSGAGDETIGNLTWGSYTLTWSVENNWNAPNPVSATQILTSVAPVVFSGTYTPRVGTLHIDVEPNTVAAGWQLSGPLGYSDGGVGDGVRSDIFAGDYVLSWNAVAGYVTPPDTMFVLGDGQDLTITCTYTREGIVFPDTGDKLVENWRKSYETMNYQTLRELLHPNFIMVLEQSTINTYPDVGAFIEYEEELRMHERLMSGQDVTDPFGALVPGIDGVTVETCTRTSAWSTSPPNDPIPNAQYALFEILMRFGRGAASQVLEVSGPIRIYVSQRDSTSGGTTRPYFRMLGQFDLTNELEATEAMHRPETAFKPSDVVDAMGVYFDTAGTNNCLAWQAMYQPFESYLILLSPQGPLDGYECTLTTIGAQRFLLSTTLPSGAVDMDATPSGFAVGAPSPLAVSGNAVLLATQSYMLTAPGALDYYLGAAAHPSMPGGRPVLANGAVLRLSSLSSGSVDLPVATVNGTCSSAARTINLGSLKCQYR